MHQPRALLCCALTAPRRAEERGTPRITPLSKASELSLSCARCRTPQRHQEPPPREAADAEPPAVSSDGFGAEQTARNTQASGTDRSDPTQPSSAPSPRASPAQGLQRGHVPKSHPGGLGSLPAPPGPQWQQCPGVPPPGTDTEQSAPRARGGFRSRALGLAGMGERRHGASAVPRLSDYAIVGHLSFQPHAA